MAGEGALEAEHYRLAGASDEQIETWKNQEAEVLRIAGASEEDIVEYFGGEGDTDNKQMVDYFTMNLDKNLPSEEDAAESPDAPKKVEGPPPTEAKTFAQAFEAGWDATGVGMAAQGELPDTILEKDADMAMQLSSFFGTVAGDLIPMAAGASTGTLVGGGLGMLVAGPPGAAVGVAIGSGAGAFAASEGFRHHLMDWYGKGEDRNFWNFWNVSSATWLSMLKGAAIGGVTVGTAKYVGKPLAKKIGLTGMAEKGLVTGSEVGAMTTMGAAVEGELPKAEDFIHGAVMIGGFKAVTAVGAKGIKVSGELGIKGAEKVKKSKAFQKGRDVSVAAKDRLAAKLRDIYAKTRTPPERVWEMAENSQALKQHLLSPSTLLPPEFTRKPLPLGSETVTQRFPDAPLSKMYIEFAKDLKSGTRRKTKKARDKELEKYSDSVRGILGIIGEQEPSARRSGREILNSWYKNVVDKLHPFNVFGKEATGKKLKDIPVIESGYKLKRLAPDANAKVIVALKDGTFNYKDFVKNGKSMTEILNGVKDPLLLKAYTMAESLILRAERGHKIPIKDLNTAHQTVKELKTEYGKAGKEWTHFGNMHLKYLKDAGFMTNKEYNKMVDAYPIHVNMKRIFTPEEIATGKKAGKGGPTVKPSSIKEARGSEREVIDPWETLIGNIKETYKMAEDNRANLQLVEQWRNSTNKELLTKVETPVKRVKIEKELIEKELKKDGVDTTGFDISPITTFAALKRVLAPDEFAIFKNGKVEVYKAKDPAVAEVAKLLGGDVTSMGAAFRVMGKFTQLKKFGITIKPSFIINNAIRDFITALSFGGRALLKPNEIVEAWGHIWKEDAVFMNWMKSGGADGAFIEIKANYLSKDLGKLQEQTKFMDKAKNIVTSNPLDHIRFAARMVESGPRIAEFKKVSGGKTDAASLLEGGFASREITLDFQRVGLKLSAWNSVIAFMNVSIQGTDRTIRAIKDNPKRATTVALGTITTPTVMLWVVNHKNPIYQRHVQQWEKDFYWNFIVDDWQPASEEDLTNFDSAPYLIRDAKTPPTTEDGKPVDTQMLGELGIQVAPPKEVNRYTVFKVPRPHELGIIFGALVERLLESFYTDKPDAFDGFAQSWLDLVTPSVTPDLALPAAEQWFNKNFFTKAPLVPGSLQQNSPALQYKPYTTQLSRELGLLVEKYVDRDTGFASPIVIENYIQQWTGGLGPQIARITESSLKKQGIMKNNVEPAKVLADNPFIGAFFARSPRSSSNAVQKFYKNLKKSRQVHADLRKLIKEGKDDEYDRRLDTDPFYEENFVKLDNIARVLREQLNEVQAITDDPSVPAEEKTQLIHSIYYEMDELAHDMNEFVRENKLDKREGEQ